jgi:hypothetical protein
MISIPFWKVVYNSDSEGLRLSEEAIEMLSTLGFTPKYGANKYSLFDEKELPRHNEILVKVVEALGSKANGFCSILKIETILVPKYFIEICNSEMGYSWERVTTENDIDWIEIDV